MKVLVIGSGGREHALCRKLSESDKVKQIFCAPGNAGTSMIATNVEINVNEIEALSEFALKENIDLTVVGPEDPLVRGIVDEFRSKGLLIFGPDKVSAQLEGSKSFSKEFLMRHSIPTARYEKHTDYHTAVEALKNFDYPVVIKADGLCAGKGVIICQTPIEALYTLKDILVEKKFGSEGKTIIIEEFLEGYEASVFCICSNGKLFTLNTAKDYKKIYENDEGPNTGGVGCFSPNILIDEKTTYEIENIIIPQIEKGLKEDDLLFSGILFIGFMVTHKGPEILEFNVRFGDPETQVLLPRMESDLYDVLYKASKGELKQEDIVFGHNTVITVIMTSGGYPGTYKTGYEITGLNDIANIDKNLFVIHNGTKVEDESIVTSGGRVLSVTAIGSTLEECRSLVYNNIDTIKFTNSYYRKDIGRFSLQ